MAIDKSRASKGHHSDPGGRSEQCSACARITQHRVTLEIREESTTAVGDAKKYSREPYRIATCSRCGHTTAVRMNDA